MEKGRIVVIDDSPIVRKLAQIALEEEGYTIYTAEDGEQGYKMAEEIRPSLILVDFIMPKVSGYQVCKMVRENEVLRDTPIILITGKGDEAGRKFTEKFGVLEYFVKPFRSEALIEKVNSILQPGEGFPPNDIASFDSADGVEPSPKGSGAPAFETCDAAVCAHSDNEQPASSADSFPGLDVSSGYGPALEDIETLVTLSAGNQTAAGTGPEGAAGGIESIDLRFLAVDEPGVPLRLDLALDPDSPVLLNEKEPLKDDDLYEIPSLSAPEDFPGGLSDTPEVVLGPDSDGPLSAAAPFAFDFDISQPEKELSLAGEASEQPAGAFDGADSLCAAGTDESCEEAAESADELIHRIAVHAVAEYIDGKLSTMLDEYEVRISSLLDKALDGGSIEGTVEKVLSRHFTTSLPSIIEDKTAEALTLLKEPPAEADIERVVERVVARHFTEHFSALSRETSEDIRNTLSSFPDKSDLASTINSALSDSPIHRALPAIEEGLAEIRDRLKSLAGHDEIGDTVGRAVARSLPENLAASLKDDTSRLLHALNELPHAGDLEKAIEAGLGEQLPAAMQALLEQHAAELNRCISGLPGRTEIEGLLAAFAAQAAPREYLPEFSKSLEDMLKQHGLIKAPGIILSGDATHLDVAQVLGMVIAGGLTGRLSVYSVSLSSEIYLQEGTICYASTSRQGRDPVLGKLFSSGAGAAEALSADASELLQHRIQSAVQETLGIRDGRFYFEQGPIPAQLEALSVYINPDLCLAGTTTGAAHSDSTAGPGDNGGCHSCEAVMQAPAAGVK